MMTMNSFFDICYVFQNFFRLSPGFCFADGLASLALLRQGMKGGSSDGVLDWNVTGASICYLGVEVFSDPKPLLCYLSAFIFLVLCVKTSRC